MLSKRSGLLFLLIALTICLVAQKRWFVVKPSGNDPAPQLNVTGMVTVDGLPVFSEIQINSILKNDKSFLKVKAKNNDGIFTLHLPKGDIYELVIEVKHFPPQIIELNTTGMDSVLTLNTYADFTSPTYDRKLEDLKRSIEEKLKNTPVFDKATFQKSYGAVAKEDLSYKVQVGAYKFLENFNYGSVIGLPKIIRHTDNDYITRFTMGNYETYDQAMVLLDRLQQNKFQDAFIIATYRGEKKYLQQLIDEKIVY